MSHVERLCDSVVLYFANGDSEVLDQVVFACHSDEALSVLADASEDERAILSAIPYHNNDVVLHTDTYLLPKTQLAWSS